MNGLELPVGVRRVGQIDDHHLSSGCQRPTAGALEGAGSPQKGADLGCVAPALRRVQDFGRNRSFGQS
eukprot:3267271-Lingulodinium_polyedra.AAC.1